MTADRSSPLATLHVIEAEDFVVLGLEGEFDLFAVPEIDERADKALALERHLILDLSEATFIDSSVIQSLIRAHSQAATQGRVCVLQLGTEAIVERVVEIGGIDQIIERAHNRAEAIRLIRRGTSATPDE